MPSVTGYSLRKDILTISKLLTLTQNEYKIKHCALLTMFVQEKIPGLL